MESQDSMEQQGNGVQPGLASARALGATLREARERTGMSVEEVAGRLKFAPRQITALEGGDFDQLPQLAFIRGFVRSYARLLQIDEKPLLDMLPGAPAPAAIQVAATRGEVLRHGAEWRKQNLFWLGGALLVVVAGIIAWKYDAGDSVPTGAKAGATVAASDATQTGGMAPAADGTQSGTTPAAGTQAAGTTTESTPAETPPAAATTGLAAQPGGQPQAPAAGQAPVTAHDSAMTAPTGAAEPVGAAHGEKKRAPEARSAAAPKPAGQEAATAVHAKPAFSGGAASSVAATGEGAPRAPRSARLVRLEFDEDSWVEVKDGTGKILLSMLGKQGTTQNVSGPLPLSVVIGNAKGVKLFYKGAPVALQPLGGSEVARLKLE